MPFGLAGLSLAGLIVTLRGRLAVLGLGLLTTSLALLPLPRLPFRLARLRLPLRLTLALAGRTTLPALILIALGLALGLVALALIASLSRLALRAVRLILLRALVGLRLPFGLVVGLLSLVRLLILLFLLGGHGALLIHEWSNLAGLPVHRRGFTRAVREFPNRAGLTWYRAGSMPGKPDFGDSVNINLGAIYRTH